MLRLRLNRSTLADLGAVAWLVLLGSVVLHPVFSAGFVLVDDHEIVSFTPQALSDAKLANPPGLRDRIFVTDPAGGRVRPLYYIIRYAEIGVLGGDSRAWHTLHAGLGVAAAVLLYASLRGFGITQFPSSLAAAWLLVAPGVSSVWIRLGPQESLACVLLVAAIWAMTCGIQPGARGGWDWMFVVFAAASALVKESFALVPPAVFALRVLLLRVVSGLGAVSVRRSLWPAAVPLVVGGVVLVIALLTVGHSSPESYGGRYLVRSAGPVFGAATLENLWTLAYLGGVVLPFLAAGVLVELRRKRQSRGSGSVRTWCGGAVVVLLLIVPQLVLYQNEPGFRVGRYILPAGLGVAGGFAAGANWLRLRRQRLLFATVSGVWIVILCLASGATWLAAETFRADSVALARLVEHIAHAAPTGATTAIAADPLTDVELAFSLPYQLALHGRQDLHTRVLVTSANSSPGTALAESRRPSEVDLNDDGCSAIAVVVLFSDEARAEQALPCLLTAGLHLETFSETVRLDEGVPAFIRHLFTPTTVSYSALTR